MAKSKTTLEDKKYLAKILYTREKLDGNLTANRVGVSPQTISKWVNEYGWKALRNRLLVGKDHQLNRFYQIVDKVNDKIEESPDGIGDTKLADMAIKYTAAIRNMETDLAIADLVESGMRFIKYIQRVGTVQQVVDTADLWNSFLQDSLRGK